MLTDWDNLRCFLVVAETGRLTAAARLLGLSQPTVGRRIKNLEARLDAKLLNRSKEKYTLTPIGESVYKLAQNVEHTIYDIERCASGKNLEPSGRVCIATTESIASCWLVKKPPEFAKRYPKIELELLTGISASDLLRGEADIALRVGVVSADSLKSRKVGEVDFGLYASNDYLNLHGRPKKLEDLQSHHIIESLRELANLPQARALRNLAQKSEVALSCNNIIAQRKAACNGLGIVALPKYVTVGVSALQRVLSDDFAIKRDLWLVAHHDLLETPCYYLVWEFLAQALEKDKKFFNT